MSDLCWNMALLCVVSLRSWWNLLHWKSPKIFQQASPRPEKFYLLPLILKNTWTLVTSCGLVLCYKIVFRLTNLDFCTFFRFAPIPTILTIILVNCLVNSHLIMYVITFFQACDILTFPHLQGLRQFWNRLVCLSSYRTACVDSDGS